MGQRRLRPTLYAAAILFVLVVLGSVGIEVLLRPSADEAASGDRVHWNGVELQVPVGSEVRNDSKLEVLADPGTRTPRRIVLGPWSGVIEGWDDEATLGEGSWAGWRISTVGEGSGGEEQEACGRLTADDGVDLAFCCSDQDELAPAPTWCLPWLASVHRTW